MGAFRDIFLPLASIAEVIGTKGRSPGTVAINQQKILQEADDRRQRQALEQEQRKSTALQNRLSGINIESGELGLNEAKLKVMAVKANKDKISNLEKQKKTKYMHTIPESGLDIDKQIEELNLENLKIEHPVEYTKLASEQTEFKKKQKTLAGLMSANADYAQNPIIQSAYENDPDFALKMIAQKEASSTMEERLMGQLGISERNKIEAEQRASVLRLKEGQLKAERERTQLIRATPKQLDDINDLLSSSQSFADIETYYKPEFVGVATGRIGALRELTGIKANPEEVKFRAAVANYKNVLLKLRSGGAVTPQEYQRFLQEAPNVNMPPEVFKARFDLAMERQKTGLKKYFEIMELANIDVSKFKPTEQKTQKERIIGGVKVEILEDTE